MFWRVYGTIWEGVNETNTGGDENTFSDMKQALILLGNSLSFQ